MSNQILFFPDNSDYIFNLISKAKESIYISSQSIPNAKYVKEVEKKANEGVDVKILLSDANYFLKNSFEKIKDKYSVHPDLIEYNIESLPKKYKYLKFLRKSKVHFINHDKFFLNHSKFMIIDKRKAFIGSAPTGRSFRFDINIVTEEKKYIGDLLYLFESDLFDLCIKNFNFNILVAPYNMKKNIIKLIKGSKDSIYFISPIITTDREIFNEIKNKLKLGVKVYALLSPFIFSKNGTISEIDLWFLNELSQLNAKIKISNHPIIHSKTFLIDVFTNYPKAYIGSANLRKNSLENSREVGVVEKNANNIISIYKKFSYLWNGASPLKNINSNFVNSPYNITEGLQEI